LDSPQTTLLFSRQLLAKNVVWNLTGQALPLLVGLITIPLLIDRLGTERFGILAIIWIVIGYFGIFDFGLGRAMTKIVADRLGAGRGDEVSQVVTTTVFIALGFGAVGALVVAAIAPWLGSVVLNIPASLIEETIRAFFLLSLSIPLVIFSVCCRGVLEAYQQFGRINAVRIPLGAFTYVGPLLVLPFTHSLIAIVAVLLLARAVACGAYWVFSSNLYVRRRLSLDRSLTKELLSLGSWMTVSNVVGPMMVYMDRLLIGSVMSMTAVAYYATPYEAITRFAFIPAAIAGVLFPALSFSIAAGRDEAAKILQRGMDLVALLMLPLLILATVLAEDGLRLWVGNEIARSGTRVLQYLTFGVLFNGFAAIAVAKVQALGRPDISAKLYLIEILPYGLTLWWLMHTYGIEGAAIAWSIRSGADLIATSSVVAWLSPSSRPALLGTAYTVAFSVVMLTSAVWASTHQMILAYMLIAFAVLIINAWFNLLQRADRLKIRSWVGRRFGT
jgi:O-antigen/teichoic acid export membrane protein